MKTQSCSKKLVISGLIFALLFLAVIPQAVRANSINQPAFSIGDGEPLFPGDEKWEAFAEKSSLPSDNLYVFDAAADGKDLYVGGYFWNFNNQNITGLAHWDGSQWSSVGNYDHSVSYIAISGKDVYVIGSAYFFQEGVSHWNGTSWSVMPFPENLCGQVLSLAALGKDVFVISHGRDYFCESSPNSPDDEVYRWDGLKWVSIGNAGIDALYTLNVIDDALFIGGVSISEGGSGTGKVARWDGNAWQNLGGGFFADKIYDIVKKGNQIFASGKIDLDEYNSRAVVNYWDGSIWHSIPGIEKAQDVISMVAVGDDLYISGFTNTLQSADQKIYGIARWDGAQFWNLGSGIISLLGKEIITESAYQMINYQNGVLVCGGFDYAGNQPVPGLAIWHPSPSVGLNYLNGAPGSEFRVDGHYFSAGSQVTVSVNRQIIQPEARTGDIQFSSTDENLTADSHGQIHFIIKTSTEAINGKYTIMIKEKDRPGIAQGQIDYYLDSDDETRVVEDNPSIPTFPVPVEVRPGYPNFLPLIVR